MELNKENAAFYEYDIFPTNISYFSYSTIFQYSYNKKKLKIKKSRLQA